MMLRAAHFGRCRDPFFSKVAYKKSEHRTMYTVYTLRPGDWDKSSPNTLFRLTILPGAITIPVLFSANYPPAGLSMKYNCTDRPEGTRSNG